MKGSSAFAGTARDSVWREGKVWFGRLEETDLEKVCKLSNLDCVLKAFGTFEGF